MALYMWQACIRCHPECRTCLGPGLSFCTSCVHFKQDGRCVAKCSSDYYVDTQYGTGSGVRQCKRCSPRCLSCTGPSASDCITCVEYKLYYDLADGNIDSRVSYQSAVLLTIFGSGTDSALPLILLFFVLFIFLLLLLGWPFSKNPKSPSFKSDRDEIRQECFSSKYAAIDGVKFLAWHHTFKLAAMTSFHPTSAVTWWMHTQHLPDTYAEASASSWSAVHSYLL